MLALPVIAQIKQHKLDTWNPNEDKILRDLIFKIQTGTGPHNSLS